MRPISLPALLVAPLAVAALTFAISGAVSGVVSAAPGDVHTVISAATLRSAPGGPEIGTVTTRTSVPLVERSRQGGWIETDRGWVWGALVSPGATMEYPSGTAPSGTVGASTDTTGNVPASPRTDTSYGAPLTAPRASNRMIVTAYASDLRQAPRSDARADLRLSQGSEVTVSKTEGEWAYVAFGDAKGWALRAHLKPSENSEPVTPVRPARSEQTRAEPTRMEPAIRPMAPPRLEPVAVPSPPPPPAFTSEPPLSLFPPRQAN